MPEQHAPDNLYLVFDPKLGLDPGDFARAWNADPACSRAAQASAAAPKGESFSLGGLEVAVLTVLGGMLTNLASSALYDLIKMKVEARLAPPPPTRRRRITLTETQMPDGSRVLAVTIEEEG